MLTPTVSRCSVHSVLLGIMTNSLTSAINFFTVTYLLNRSLRKNRLEADKLIQTQYTRLHAVRQCLLDDVLG